MDVPLGFLGAGEYLAHLCTDAPETDLERAPDAVAISAWLVDAATTVRAEMAGGSGHSMRIAPATADDLVSLTRYR